VTHLNDFVVHVFINVHNGCFVAAPASQDEILLSTLKATRVGHIQKGGKPNTHDKTTLHFRKGSPSGMHL
jgi:hypothetical protein